MHGSEYALSLFESFFIAEGDHFLSCRLAGWPINNLTSFYYSGIAFVRANTEELIREMNNHYPHWFAIVFPSMVELAQTVGVHLVFFDGLSTVVSELFNKQQQILEK